MSSGNSKMQLRYQGYLNTPLLWTGKGPLALEQLALDSIKTPKLHLAANPKLRLGKLVERFVLAELMERSHIEILASNTQIQHNKITVGELDCLLTQEKQPIHLEIIYKFYLYDSSAGSTPVAHWIGPNRRDALVKKLNKLKDKQLPLLFNEHCQPLLSKLQLKPEEIKQQVWFKAQLFTPYHSAKVDFNGLNSNCLAGFYVNQTAIGQFKDCKFVIPTKLDWLLEPQHVATWLNFNAFKIALEPILAERSAPLCWIKFPNGECTKFFVCWW